MGKAMTAICDHYGVDDQNELLTDADFMTDVMDSVQPSFCVRCGMEGDYIEPDGVTECADECGGKAYPIQRLVLGI